MSDLLSVDLPAKKKHVRIGVAAVVLICVTMYCVDLWLISKIAAEVKNSPHENSTLSINLGIIRTVTENLMAGAIVALILALTFRWVVQAIDPRDRVIEVSPDSITSRLKENARLTNNYLFIGNTATFVTATVLPILTEVARSSRRMRRVELYILDPMDTIGVSSYVLFKQQVVEERTPVADPNFGRWVAPTHFRSFETEPQVIAKLLAAIYLAAYASVQSSMDVSVFLRRSFTPFRADITDKEVVLTQESAEEAAVAFSSLGHFYNWYNKEATALKPQSIKIDLVSQRSVLISKVINPPGSGTAAIRGSLITLLGLYPHLSPLMGRTDVINLAVKRIRRPSHSY